MTSEPHPNLTSRVLLLVLIAFLPALGLYWYANREIRELQLSSQEQELLRATRETSVEYSRLLEESRVLLATLAQFPQIRDAQQPSCNQILGRVFDQSNNLNGIWAIGLDGYVLCGSVEPEGLLYLGDRAYYIRVMNENRHVIGNYQIGRVTGRPGVGSAIPIPSDDGTPGGVLIASIDLRALGEGAREVELPSSATFTVLDRDGRVLVRYPTRQLASGGDTIGSTRGEGFPLQPDDLESSIVRGADLDGSESIFAIAPLRGEGDTPEGYLAIGRPVAELTEDVDRIVSNALGFLAIAGLAVLTAAWIFGHYTIVKPVSAA